MLAVFLANKDKVKYVYAFCHKVRFICSFDFLRAK